MESEKNTCENQEVRRILGDETLPNVSITHPSSPVLNCHGFGQLPPAMDLRLIRAIDLDKKLFYFLTPLSLTELAKVTVFARGTDIMVPQHLLECQPATNVPYLSRPALASVSGIISDLYGGLRNVRPGRREYFPANS
ncbi:hypothetical protein ANCDUO_03979 [Ancylostoma duodenale]|uniref:Uncharacterized protein n=1 Tax=Ancylostoma duodenale TaxID=51022 RepID=A0A0C2GW02_9BILA|nr:hypothetical protein ANCDUO_03979 [Ancylostoma duodenale]